MQRGYELLVKAMDDQQNTVKHTKVLRTSVKATEGQ